MEVKPRALPSARCGDLELLERACTRLEALPVVNGNVRFDEKHNCGVGRVVVNLWCHSDHEKKDRQPYVGLNSKPLTDAIAVPSYQVAVERLIQVVETKHGGCLAAAERAKAAAAASSTTGSSSEARQQPLDALQAMMRLQAARTAAAEANRVALAAEQAKDAAEAELAALEEPGLT